MPILATVLLLAGCGGSARDAHEIVVTPRQHGDWLLVLLHGATGRPDDFLRPQLTAALAALGPRAPVVLLADGGDHSYWHDRRGGQVGSDTLAAIERLGFRRVAIGGISMGGYGALWLGRRRQFCAIGAHSPALWRRFADSAPGAFDDAADFRAHDVFEGRSYRAPVWVDVGRDDGFRPADVAFARRMHAQLHVWPGGHDWSYWDAHLRSYLRFYADHCVPEDRAARASGGDGSR